jgi:DNA-binding GntR family transcriptional regulator
VATILAATIIQATDHKQICLKKLFDNPKRSTSRPGPAPAKRAGRKTAVARGQRPAGKKHGPSSPDQVVATIRHGILIGRYVPGQRLIEADLTSELRVSRGPVREALKRLAAEGVVALSPHRGAYIRALARSEVRDLLDVLEAIVSLASRLAAERIDRPGNRARLAAAYRRLERHGATGDPVALAIDRTGFYDSIFEVAGNRELARMNPVVPTLILRIQVQPYRSRKFRTEQFADYRRLYQAITRGDAASARRVAEKHVRHSRKHAMSLADEAFPAEPGHARSTERT